MTGKTCLLALSAAVPAAGGCSQVLGFRDPVLEDASRNNAPDDATIDTAPVSFVPIHLDATLLLAGAPDVVLAGNPSIVDTTSLAMDGASSAFLVRQGPYVVLHTNRFSVQHELVIRGSAALIIAARGEIAILGNINLSAKGSVSGPGAATIGVGVGNPGGAFALDTGFDTAGGGGGSFGSAGGRGGADDPTHAPPGAAGQTYGATLTGPLVGGSSGGAGGHASSGGGGGGGALQLSSAIAITLSGSYVNANGGGGLGGDRGFNGGGGGGAGGEILLEAPSITVAGTLVANGGGGGAGGTDGGMPVSLATDGEDGGLTSQPARGGIGQIHGADGGQGAAMDSAQVFEAGSGRDFGKDGGGGGGGMGRIWLRYRASSPPLIVGGAVFSPLPGMDATLP